jgi:hypothetical protein
MFPSLSGFIGFVYTRANNKVSENKGENFSGVVKICSMVFEIGEPCSLLA